MSVHIEVLESEGTLSSFDVRKVNLEHPEHSFHWRSLFNRYVRGMTRVPVRGYQFIRSNVTCATGGCAAISYLIFIILATQLHHYVHATLLRTPSINTQSLFV